jgi:penicillin-binding protein 1C
VGVTGGHVIVVWAGNADGSPSPNLKGQRAALPLMVRLLAAARNVRREIFSAEFVAPPPGGRIMDVEVCALSRMAATAHTPKREWTKAIRGVTQLRPCDVHRPVHVDVMSGELRPHAAEDGSTRTEVREFWPPEFLESFRLAGRPREKSRQKEAENCVAVAGFLRPEIVSPQSGSRIVLDAAVGGHVYLRARPLPGDPDLHWFVNGAYLGRARSSGVMEWLPRRGANTVTACTSTAICGSVRVVVE